MTHDDALHRIDKSLSGDLASAAADLLRPGIGITSSKAKHATALSRFGGRPCLPAGVPWPRWDARPCALRLLDRLEAWMKKAPDAPGLQLIVDRYRAQLDIESTPLSFLAQIDLAEISKFETSIPIPIRGTLLFFYDALNLTSGSDPRNQPGWRILYSANRQTTPTSPPADLNPKYNWPESSLHFEQAWTLPTRSVMGPPAAHPQEQAWYALIDELNGNGRQRIQRLAGWPDEIQHRMEAEVQLAAHGIELGDPTSVNDSRIPTLELGAKNWKLLLQLDSDPIPGWMWGDAGRLYFWVRDEELQNHNFDNVWCIMQCY